MHIIFDLVFATYLFRFCFVFFNWLIRAAILIETNAENRWKIVRIIIVKVMKKSSVKIRGGKWYGKHSLKSEWKILDFLSCSQQQFKTEIFQSNNMHLHIIWFDRSRSQWDNWNECPQANLNSITKKKKKQKKILLNGSCYNFKLLLYIQLTYQGCWFYAQISIPLNYIKDIHRVIIQYHFEFIFLFLRF